MSKNKRAPAKPPGRNPAGDKYKVIGGVVNRTFEKNEQDPKRVPKAPLR